MAIVYIHKRVSDNQIFYIGIGEEYKRAYDKFSRNRWWTYYTKKYDYEVVITHKDIIWEEACIIEKYLISFYGRRDLKQGSLLNLTDGGEGTLGRITSEEVKKQRSIQLTGIKRSPESVKKAQITKVKIKAKRAPISIQQIDCSTLEVLAEFDSIKNAADVSSTSRRSISYSLNTFFKRKYKDRILPKAGNYYWKIKN